MLSLIGTWVQMVAQSWLVYRLSGSPVMLGLVGFANQVASTGLDFAGTVENMNDGLFRAAIESGHMAGLSALIWLATYGGISKVQVDELRARMAGMLHELF